MSTSAGAKLLPGLLVAMRQLNCLHLHQRLLPVTHQALSAGWRAGGRRLATSGHAAGLIAETDVEAAVEYAIKAAGRKVTPADLQMAAELRNNWYMTAGDIAAMSQEELELLHVPVKLWSIVQTHISRAGSDQPQPPPAVSASPEQPQQHELQDQQQPRRRRRQSSSGLGSQQPEAATPALQPPDTAGVDAVQLEDAAFRLQALHTDVMQRPMPKRAAPPAARASSVRHKPLLSQVPYALKESEMSDALRAELQEFERFCTTRFFGQLVEPVRPITHDKVTLHNIKMLLGFAHRVRGVPLDQLSLKTLLPSTDREAVSLLLDFNQWRQQERGVSATTTTNTVKCLVHVGRFLFHDQAQPNDPQTGQRQRYPYQSIEVMQELASIQRAGQRVASGASRVSDEAKKWLKWDEFLGMVRALRAECAGLTAAGAPRKRSDVAASLQRYLIVAILSVVPDRQRTLRELEVGRTLLQRDGAWIIKHGPNDYKTGKRYGDRPPLVIAPFIYPELEAFINTWRQELKPKTNMLFCKPKTGEAMAASDLYYSFRNTALRLTGKATHPHLVRDMIVTHLRMQRKGEAHMESLALYMGHSLEMQKASYDRRTQAQKVAPAMELLQGLHARKAARQ